MAGSRAAMTTNQVWMAWGLDSKRSGIVTRWVKTKPMYCNERNKDQLFKLRKAIGKKRMQKRKVKSHHSKLILLWKSHRSQWQNQKHKRLRNRCKDLFPQHQTMAAAAPTPTTWSVSISKQTIKTKNTCIEMCYRNSSIDPTCLYLTSPSIRWSISKFVSISRMFAVKIGRYDTEHSMVVINTLATLTPSASCNTLVNYAFQTMKLMIRASRASL